VCADFRYPSSNRLDLTRTDCGRRRLNAGHQLRCAKCHKIKTLRDIKAIWKAKRLNGAALSQYERRRRFDPQLRGRPSNTDAVAAPPLIIYLEREADYATLFGAWRERRTTTSSILISKQFGKRCARTGARVECSALSPNSRHLPPSFVRTPTRSTGSQQTQRRRRRRLHPKACKGKAEAEAKAQVEPQVEAHQ